MTVETLGGDDVIEQRETRERRRRNPIRQYKIQEVIKRRQILLVQVVKEERGNKGAALTTYLSLAGRYCVLMPNAGRGGGISRKISNPADRKRMKEVLGELDVPQGMGVILRTAGLERSHHRHQARLRIPVAAVGFDPRAHHALDGAGADLRGRRPDQALAARRLRHRHRPGAGRGRGGLQRGVASSCASWCRTRPSKVELYKEPIPLFHRYQVESQFDAMHSPVVQLRSGGYIVINPTEALVAIDVNSGRSTKERNIEETALRTNIEAAEEIARQVRLRDLAGLIVIDFIDMEETRHQRQVEHKVKDAMRNDRARIQIGRISAFGLLEMSRQRLRPSLLEHSTEICPHCAGTGRIRSIESAALHALRAIEEEGVRRRAGEIVVSVPPNVALYLLNQKRHTLSEIEKRYGFYGDHRGRRRTARRRLRDRARARPARRPRPAGPGTGARQLRRGRRRGPAAGRRGRSARGARGRRWRGDAGGERGEDERRQPPSPPAAPAARRGATATRTATAIVRRPWARRIRPTSGAGPRRQRRGATTTTIRARSRARRRTTSRATASAPMPTGERTATATAVAADAAAADAGAARTAMATRATMRRVSTASRPGHRDQGRRTGQREEYRAAEPNGGDSRRGRAHGEAPVASAPMPIEGMPVEQMPDGHMPVEHAPYDARRRWPRR